MNRFSLADAQASFRDTGVADAAMSQFNRKPRRHDRRDPDWRPFDKNKDGVDPTQSMGSSDDATHYYWRVGRPADPIM